MSKSLTDEQKKKIIEMKEEGFGSRAIAKEVLGAETKKSTVNDFLATVITHKAHHPKIAILDIETSPEVSFHFGRFKVNINESMSLEYQKVLGFAYKWLGDEKVNSHYPKSFPAYMQDSSEEKAIIQSAHDVLSEADVVVAHNGDNFDIPVLNARMAFFGHSKPKPFKSIDTLKIARKEFRFPQNKLDVIANYFGIGRKMDHDGFDLWRGCMMGDEGSWKHMMSYNITDVVLLEEVYLKIAPWSARIPNLSLYYPNGVQRCPQCGSVHLNKHHKMAYTQVSVFDLYQCDDCGSWARGRTNIKTKEQRQNIYTTVR